MSRQCSPSQGATTEKTNTDPRRLIRSLIRLRDPQALPAFVRFAAAMGVIGSLLPAGRAARLPVTFALRQA